MRQGQPPALWKLKMQEMHEVIHAVGLTACSIFQLLMSHARRVSTCLAVNAMSISGMHSITSSHNLCQRVTRQLCLAEPLQAKSTRSREEQNVQHQGFPGGHPPEY